MAPRRRRNGRKVGLTRMDAAMDAMGVMGFQPATRIRKKVRELLKVYGGDEGWPFIEDGSYNVLVEALLDEDNSDSGPLLLKDAASEDVAEASNMGEGAASNIVSGETQIGTFMAFEDDLTEDEKATPTLMEPVIPSSSQNIGENQMDSGETHMGDTSTLCADIRGKGKRVVLSSSHCKSGEIHMGTSSITKSRPPQTKPVLNTPDQGMGEMEIQMGECSAVKVEFMEDETPVSKPLQLSSYDQGLAEAKILMGDCSAVKAEFLEDETPVIKPLQLSLHDQGLGEKKTQMGNCSAAKADVMEDETAKIKPLKPLHLSSYQDPARKTQLVLGLPSCEVFLNEHKDGIPNAPFQDPNLAVQIKLEIPSQHELEELVVQTRMGTEYNSKEIYIIPPFPNRHMIKSLVPPPPPPPVCSAVCDQAKSSSSPHGRKRCYGWIGCDENDYVLLEANEVKGNRQRGRRYKRGEVKWDVNSCISVLK